jgi:hypothetical protein
MHGDTIPDVYCFLLTDRHKNDERKVFARSGFGAGIF